MEYYVEAVLPVEENVEPFIRTDDHQRVEQFSDEFCKEMKEILYREDEIPFVIDDERLLAGTAEAGTQIVIQNNLKKQVLHISHYSRLSAH